MKQNGDNSYLINDMSLVTNLLITGVVVLMPINAVIHRLASLQTPPNFPDFHPQPLSEPPIAFALLSVLLLLLLSILLLLLFFVFPLFLCTAPQPFLPVHSVQRLMQFALYVAHGSVINEQLTCWTPLPFPKCHRGCGCRHNLRLNLGP